MTTQEFTRLRSDFPLLTREVAGTPLAYLDSGATSQKPECVIDAEQEFNTRHNSAVHRGAHTLATEATDAFEGARAKVAAFVGAKPSQVCWMKNATEALNVVAMGMGFATAGPLALGPGDSIVITQMEHHANLVPWQQVALRTGAELRYIPITDEGTLDLSDVDSIADASTKVMAFTHVSNVLATVNPVEQLVEHAKKIGAVTVLDACQSVPHMQVDFPAMDVDFAAFSGHKMLGPSGIGVLYGKQDALNALPPVLTGGSMIETVTMEESTFLPAPQRFEAGTQPVAQAVGLAAAVDYLTHVGMDRIAQHEQELAQILAEGVAKIPGVRLLGPANRSVSTVAVDVEGVHAHDVGQFLDADGVAVRVGHHCAMPLHARLGVRASTRASAYVYSTVEECERFLDSLARVRGYFGAES